MIDGEHGFSGVAEALRDLSIGNADQHHPRANLARRQQRSRVFDEAAHISATALDAVLAEIKDGLCLQIMDADKYCGSDLAGHGEHPPQRMPARDIYSVLQHE